MGPPLHRTRELNDEAKIDHRGSLKVLRMASRKMFTGSGGVPGGEPGVSQRVQETFCR